ncbi:Nitroreductase NfnB [subsurface metagenome]
MELLEGIETRRSYRAFESTPISRETIERILKVASNSPSYTNTQPWQVAVVTGKKKEELSRILCELARADTIPNPDLPLPKSWPPELGRRAREHGARRLKVLGIERGDEKQRKELQLLNWQFYGAPCVFFLFMDSTLSSWSIFDMGLFAQNVILAAHSRGLGSCLQGSVANYPDTVREFLGMPKTKLLILGISIGYPALDAKINSYRSKKVGAGEFVQWYS